MHGEAFWACGTSAPRLCFEMKNDNWAYHKWQRHAASDRHTVLDSSSSLVLEPGKIIAVADAPKSEGLGASRRRTRTCREITIKPECSHKRTQPVYSVRALCNTQPLVTKLAPMSACQQVCTLASKRGVTFALMGTYLKVDTAVAMDEARRSGSPHRLGFRELTSCASWANGRRGWAMQKVRVTARNRDLSRTRQKRRVMRGQQGARDTSATRQGHNGVDVRLVERAPCRNGGGNARVRVVGDFLCASHGPEGGDQLSRPTKLRQRVVAPW